jgi:hypothetical protein
MFQAMPINGETWLICGGRDFADSTMFCDAMGRLIGLRGCPSRVVHGAARGADRMAGEWARNMALDEIAVPADWNANGKAAGPIRNQKMLDDHHPKFVVAFPGGRGTADMIARARKAGIDVAEIKPQ